MIEMYFVADVSEFSYTMWPGKIGVNSFLPDSENIFVTLQPEDKENGKEIEFVLTISQTLELIERLSNVIKAVGTENKLFY